MTVVKTYKDLLALHSVRCRELKASVRLTTSDVGISGANLYPSLIVDGRNIPLGSPLKLEHKNKATMDDFEKRMWEKANNEDIPTKVSELENDKNYFTVNSSPYAKEVYEHLGFECTDDLQCINGLKFYPMTMKVKRLTR